MSRRSDYLLVSTLLFAVVLAVFGHVVRFDFVTWDDDLNIYRNPEFGGISIKRLGWMFTDVQMVQRFKPLTWLGWSLIYEGWQLRPLGYHLANVLLHGLNTILLYFVGRKLLAMIRSEDGDRRWVEICAAMGALFWALNPLRVEVVAWVSAFGYQLALAFVQISFLYYLRAFEEGGNNYGRRIIASIVAFAGSLLAYPLAFGYVAALAVVDVYPLRRWPIERQKIWTDETRKMLLEKVMFALVAAGILGITLYGRIHASGSWSAPLSLSEFGWLERAAQSFYIWAHYLWKPFLPLDLSPVYVTLIGFKPTEGRFMASFVAVLAVSIICLALRKRWPALLVAWLCHLVLLIPNLGLTEHPHYPSDRYSVLAGIPLALLIASGVYQASNLKMRQGAAIFCLLALVGLGAASWKQTFVWRNSVALFEHTITKLGNDPYRADILRRVAIEYMQRGEWAAAEAAWKEMLLIAPRYADGHFYLGNTLLELHKPGQAIIAFRETLRLAPQTPNARSSLAMALGMNHQFDESVAEFRAHLAANPDDADAHVNLATSLARQGNTNEAQLHRKRADELRARRTPNENR